MDVKIIYSKEQLEATVEFISTHNSHFLGKKAYIRESILKSMRRIAKDPEQWVSGTMGYMLWGDREFEGMDSDENIIHFDIAVNPSLDFTDDTYIEEIVHG